ncbi:hypothetical protein CFI10_02410 [Marinobacterium iners]|uniref:DUF932 domain-containing protein n=1 Tax=Marinobacterium iners TaxID=48076 RepID=UPI001A8C1706|nr:DUF932 domain-containing protein [Marinobacterium iners]QSR33847.1 hypothetical protein CFI10_02410 [Marinobacterium iners]
MKRSWKEKDVTQAFFPVAMKPVFIQTSEGRQDLFDHTAYEQLPRHQAVVDTDKNLTFAVVTDSYRLITNQEAYNLAADAMRTVFKMTSMKDMQCLNVTMPKTRSFCHIDLIHTKSEFEPWEKDRWTPFVRITNSYNRTHRLRFEIGFCRWICLNGVIFGSKSVEISFAHTRQLEDAMKRWEENLAGIHELERLFVSQLRNLQRYHVPAKWMLPLTCKVFDLRLPPEAEIKRKRAEELIEFRNAIADRTSDYFVKMGEHGYAALNVLSDYASHPVGVMAPESKMDGYQHKTGEWIMDFIEQIEKRDFTFEAYLADYLDTAQQIAELKVERVE